MCSVVNTSYIKSCLHVYGGGNATQNSKKENHQGWFEIFRVKFYRLGCSTGPTVSDAEVVVISSIFVHIFNPEVVG